MLFGLQDVAPTEFIESKRRPNHLMSYEFKFFRQNTIVVFMFRTMFVYDAPQIIHVDAVNDMEHLLGCNNAIGSYIHIRLFY
jgi:hypothetical protein